MLGGASFGIGRELLPLQGVKSKRLDAREKPESPHHGEPGAARTIPQEFREASASGRRVDRNSTVAAHFSISNEFDVWVGDRATIPASKVLNRSEPQNPSVIDDCQAPLVCLAVIREGPQNSLARG